MSRVNELDVDNASSKNESMSFYILLIVKRRGKPLHYVPPSSMKQRVGH